MVSSFLFHMMKTAHCNYKHRDNIDPAKEDVRILKMSQGKHWHMVKFFSLIMKRQLMVDDPVTRPA